jgi:hypothetical protein
VVKGPRVVFVEELPPEICEACGRLDELRPYGKRQANGVRLWLCFDCAMKDEAEAARAFAERFTGENEV